MSANEELPLKRFLVKYHQMHTRVIEAPTIADAARQLEAIVAKLPKGSMMVEIRVEPEPVKA